MKNLFEQLMDFYIEAFGPMTVLAARVMFEDDDELLDHLANCYVKTMM